MTIVTSACTTAFSLWLLIAISFVSTKWHYYWCRNVWQEQQNKNHTRTMMTLTQPPFRNKTEEKKELIIWDIFIQHSHWSQTYLSLCWSSLHFAGDSGNDRCHQSGRAWSRVHTSHDVCGPAAGCLHHATIGEACPGTRWWSASHQFGRARPLHQRHTADDLKESRALMTGKKEKRSSWGRVVPSLVFLGTVYIFPCPIHCWWVSVPYSWEQGQLSG